MMHYSIYIPRKAQGQRLNWWWNIGHRHEKQNELSASLIKAEFRVRLNRGKLDRIAAGKGLRSLVIAKSLPGGLRCNMMTLPPGFF